MKRILKTLAILIISVLVTALIIFIAVWGADQDKQTEDRLWNNGICSCEGHYQLFDIERTRGDEYYYYKCDKCNGIFRTTHYFKYEN